jgi:hypothetical protein
MTSPILTSTYNFDNASQRWRDSVTGQFVPKADIVAELRIHQEATYARLNGLTKQLYAGEISLARWQVATASEIKNAHLAQAMFGAGGRANMGNAEWGRVGQTLKEQYRFLDQFAQQIALGHVSEAQALNRIEMYGDASQQSYWGEWAQQRKGKKIYYRLHPAEHCGDCLDRAAGNPYTMDNLRGYPGDGSTKCGPRDKCTMEEEDEV